MPSALLIGLPRDHVRRIRSAVEGGRAQYLSGWEVGYIPSPRKDTVEIRPTEIERAIEQASQFGGAHILGFSKQDGRVRQDIARKIRPHFRFVWMKNDLLARLHTPADFLSGINGVLSGEEWWRQQIQPQDCTSPLLLPESCFDVEHPHQLIWEEANQYGDPKLFESVARRLDHFGEVYWQNLSGAGRRWIDRGRRVFDHTGPRHAQAPSPRDYKFSYPIPAGFHYDVKHMDERPFRLLGLDARGYQVVARGYLNVDPHGHVRRTG